MIDDFIWNLMKNELVKGVDDNRKENICEVFDLVRDQTQEDNLKMLLPIVRRVYPTLSKILEPKYFVDQLLKKINIAFGNSIKNNALIFNIGLRETFYFNTHCNTFDNTLKTNDIDIEAELMAFIAATIAKEFEEEVLS